MGYGYGICYNVWAIDKTIKDERGLLLIISHLILKNGKCDKSNFFFSEIFDETQSVINDRLSNLQLKGYINMDYKNKNGDRLITIVHPENIE